MRTDRKDKKKKHEPAGKKTYEKPRMTIKARVPETPAAWGSFEP